MVTMGEVAETPECQWCKGRELEWIEAGWADCNECSATIHYSKKLGMVDYWEPPQDMDVVRDLILSLKTY